MAKPITKTIPLSERFGKATAVLLLLFGTVIFGLPLYIMVTMAFKTPHEIAVSSPWALPETWKLSNFGAVLSNPNVSFYIFFKNTTIIAVMATLGATITSAMVAYPFARLNFRGRDRLFIVLLSTMMLPGIVTMIPSYVLFKYLHWIDTLYPLWVPAWFGGGAFNVFLLRQFFMGIPKEFDEAAILDGASHAKIFWSLIVPNSKAALATVAVFAFIYNWRDFLDQLIFLNSPNKQTLEVGLSTYNSLNSSQWNLLMAAAVLVMIPVFFIFLGGQKYFVKGIVMTGGK